MKYILIGFSIATSLFISSSRATELACLRHYQPEIRTFQMDIETVDDGQVLKYYKTLRNSLESELFSGLPMPGHVVAEVSFSNEPSLEFSTGKSKLVFPLLKVRSESALPQQLRNSDAIFIHEYTHFITLTKWQVEIENFDEYFNHKNRALSRVKPYHEEKDIVNAALAAGEISFRAYQQFNFEYLESLAKAEEKAIHAKKGSAIIQPYNEFVSDLAVVLFTDDAKSVRFAIEHRRRHTMSPLMYIRLRLSQDTRARDFDMLFSTQETAVLEEKNRVQFLNDTAGYSGIALAKRPLWLRYQGLKARVSKAFFFQLALESATQALKNELANFELTGENYTVEKRSQQLIEITNTKLRASGIL